MSLEARRKLTDLPQDSSALWTEQVHDLQLKIEERNRLDFKELRRRDQAMLALNFVNLYSFLDPLTTQMAV